MSNVPISAPAAPAARGGSFFWSAATAGFIGVAFDADDRKDQDGAHAFARSAIQGRTRPPRNRIRRKFNDGGHSKLSVGAAWDLICLATAIIKIRTWLTAS
jgi:hypothetical protein